MYKSRAFLLNFCLSPDFYDPNKITYNPSDRVELENAFELIPDILGIKYINEEDKKILKNTLLRERAIPSDEFVIEWRHENLEDIEDMFNPIYKVFFSLRLFKEGSVNLSFIYTKDENKNVIVKRINYAVPFEEIDYNRIIDYKLFFNEKEDYKKLFTLFNLLSTDNDSINIALDRFNSTYDIKPARDALIDLMIGFEALFLKNYRFNAKGNVIALACSMLLGKNNLERSEINKILFNFYRIRNDIIHGSKYCEQEIKDNYYTLKDYLRRSIIKLLQ